MEKNVADIVDLITQAEAARLRNVTRSAISDLVRRGRLKGIQVAGQTFVRRTDVLQLGKAKTGPKPKAQK